MRDAHLAWICRIWKQENEEDKRKSYLEEFNSSSYGRSQRHLVVLSPELCIPAEKQIPQFRILES